MSLLKQFPPHKQKAIVQIAAGVSSKDVAKELGVPVSTIYFWRQDSAFIEAISDFAAQKIEEAIAEFNPHYKRIIERSLDIAFDEDNNPEVQLKALSFAAGKIEKSLSFRNDREIRELNRILKGLPKDDDLLSRAREEIASTKASSEDAEDESNTSE